MPVPDLGSLAVEQERTTDGYRYTVSAPLKTGAVRLSIDGEDAVAISAAITRPGRA